MTDSESHFEYHRYHIHTEEAPDIVNWPERFKTSVGKIGLASHLLHEIWRTRADMGVVTSRPCMYGVYSGPVGGFWPRPQKCVACLRCTVEYSHFVQIDPNPKRRALGDTYFSPEYIEAVIYESETGRVPVKGAGYRGAFGGEGWDGMWTDMSEIVRPTRDGIHGREFISTVVDIGEKPIYLTLNAEHTLAGEFPPNIQLPLPMILDIPAEAVASSRLNKIFLAAAEEMQTLTILPVAAILDDNLQSPAIVPLVTVEDAESLAVLPFSPRMIEMAGWDESLYTELRRRYPQTLVCLRVRFPSADDLMKWAGAGIRVFHFTANYHGQSKDGKFIFDMIRDAHQKLVEERIRDQFTLIGSGGVIAAEHVAKAIIAGLDVVALDTPLVVALQGRLGHGRDELIDRKHGKCVLPRNIPPAWGVQRILNMCGAWRDQMLEMMGAMGLREVRRLRGEIGRAMFQKTLEREAFGQISGYKD